MITDEEKLNDNFSIEESEFGTLVLKYKGQEVVPLSNPPCNGLLPVLNLIKTLKDEEENIDN